VQRVELASGAVPELHDVRLQAHDKPSGSQFTLTDRPPNLAENLEPIKLAGRWVACSASKTWLEISPDLGWICADAQGASVSP
jgi:hypothetical protein